MTSFVCVYASSVLVLEQGDSLRVGFAISKTVCHQLPPVCRQLSNRKTVLRVIVPQHARATYGLSLSTRLSQLLAEARGTTMATAAKRQFAALPDGAGKWLVARFIGEPTDGISNDVGGGNGIDQACAKVLAAYLDNDAAGARGRTVLDLSADQVPRFSSVENGAWQPLFAALANNAHVVDLQLRGLCIGPANAKHFVGMLSANATLRVVNVDAGDKTGIGVDGATLLAPVLMKHPSLTAIHLGNNSIVGQLRRPETRAAEALLVALASNPRLTTLGLRQGDLPPQLQLRYQQLVTMHAASVALPNGGVGLSPSQVNGVMFNLAAPAGNVAPWHTATVDGSPALVYNLESGERLVSRESLEDVGCRRDGKPPHLTAQLLADQVNVGQKVQTVLSAALTLWDYVSDLLVLGVFLDDGHTGLFWVSLMILIVSNLMASSILWRAGRAMDALLQPLGLGIVVDTLRVIRGGTPVVHVDLTSRAPPLVGAVGIDRLRRVEALAESAPQLLVQLYYVVRVNAGAAQSVLAVSLVTGLLSLANLLFRSDIAAVTAHALRGDAGLDAKGLPKEAPARHVKLRALSADAAVIALYRTTEVAARVGVVALFVAVFEEYFVFLLCVSLLVVIAWWLGNVRNNEGGVMGRGDRAGWLHRRKSMCANAIAWLFCPWFTSALYCCRTPCYRCSKASALQIPTDKSHWAPALLWSLLAFPGTDLVTMPLDMNELLGGWTTADEAWIVVRTVENAAVLACTSIIGVPLTAKDGDAGDAEAAAAVPAVEAWIPIAAVLVVAHTLMFPLYLHSTRSLPSRPVWADASELPKDTSGVGVEMPLEGAGIEMSAAAGATARVGPSDDAV